MLQEWFYLSSAGRRLNYDVLRGFGSEKSAVLKLQTTTPAFPYQLCPGEFFCDHFFWSWSDEAVWMTIDALSGSCTRLEAVCLKWVLPVVWLLSACAMTSCSVLLFVGALFPHKAALKLFCGKISFVSGCASIFIFIFLWSSDIFNSGISFRCSDNFISRI